MSNLSEPWNYLILTAANGGQAAAYEAQIGLRRETDPLNQVRHVVVVADPQGRRAGSGGSTIQCLLEVLRRESKRQTSSDLSDAETILSGLRILIVHAGGDSRRLPAYSHCGKIFVPLPGEQHGAVTPALFDRLVPAFMRLPNGSPGSGQIVVAAGDALIRFDPAEVHSPRAGITALGSRVSPVEAARHGVLCPASDGSVRLFLQKPDLRKQTQVGAISADGRSVLDVGIMSLDAGAAVQLLATFGTSEARHTLLLHAIDLYREICCALGTETTLENYVSAVRSSGSKLDETTLARLFAELRTIPLHCQVLSQCSFLHFGSTSQLIASGLELITQDLGAAPVNTVIAIGNDIRAGAEIQGENSWVEGCRLGAPLRLQGRNVVVGVDIPEPLELPVGACLDVSRGSTRAGRKVWFVRYYGVDDSFKHSVTAGATFCGKPLAEWLRAASVPQSEVWTGDMPEAERTLWNARLFPAESDPNAYRRWQWMLNIDCATPEQKSSFLAADRYSSAEIAVSADCRSTPASGPPRSTGPPHRGG